MSVSDQAARIVGLRDFTPGEPRPIRHAHRRIDARPCGAVVGHALTLDGARAFIGRRCPVCKRRVFRVDYPLRAWVYANENETEGGS